MCNAKQTAKERVIDYAFFALFFYFVSILGFIGEVIIYWFNNRSDISLLSTVLTFRGFLHGPWVPIYGVGCLVILILSYFIPSVLEYCTSWILEKAFSAKSQFLNLDGRICLKASLFFGVAAVLVIYILFPIYEKIITRLPQRNRFILCALISVVFLVDVFISIQYPNLGLDVKLII